MAFIVDSFDGRDSNTFSVILLILLMIVVLLYIIMIRILTLPIVYFFRLFKKEVDPFVWLMLDERITSDVIIANERKNKLKKIK